MIVLFKDELDVSLKTEIKEIIIDKLLNCNYPLFYWVNKIKTSDETLKELYADLVLKMVQEFISYDAMLVDDILKFASLDALIYYGADSKNEEISQKCTEEFYKRVYEAEDKEEIYKKKRMLRN